MFLTFSSQEERREYGGSSFIEIQFCKMPLNADIKKIVAVESIKNWQNDSLYINDIEDFYLAYGNIFDCGVYNNLKSGALDICGINYYKPILIEMFVDKILADKPKDYEILIEWLNKAKKYSGFYILGI